MSTHPTWSAGYIGDDPTAVIVLLHGRGGTGARLLASMARRDPATMAELTRRRVRLVLPTATSLSEDGRRVWGHVIDGEDDARVCDTVARANVEAPRVLLAGESYGASMVWWLARYRPSLVDGWAPCNCPMPYWATQPSGVVYHELGLRDRKLFASAAEVLAHAADAAGRLGCTEVDARNWRRPGAWVSVAPRGGHGMRPRALLRALDLLDTH